METNLQKAFAEAKKLANLRDENQQKAYIESWERKRFNNLNKSNKDDSKS